MHALELKAEKKKPVKKKGPGMMPAAIQYLLYVESTGGEEEKEGTLEKLKTAPLQVLVDVAHFAKTI